MVLVSVLLLISTGNLRERLSGMYISSFMRQEINFQHRFISLLSDLGELNWKIRNQIYMRRSVFN
jgi:hypothetical protein